MSQELTIAEDQLRCAMDRYVRACSSVNYGEGQISKSPDLLGVLDGQSNNIASQVHGLRDARTLVHSARGNVSKASFPVEILSHIFRFITPGHLCLVQRNYQEEISQIKYPLYPNNLAHVCSFWRRVAIGTPSLWTHIDLVLDHSLNPGSFARARVYAIRAGQLPLEIHISDPGSERERKRESAIREGKLDPKDPSRDPAYNWGDLHHFKIFAPELELATVPIKTLEIDLCVYGGRVREVYFSVFEYFLARCKPGVLAQYIVRYGPFGTFLLPEYFIEAAGAPPWDNRRLLQVPPDHLEEIWRGVSIIRVGGIFPYWTSKAYHGLVELHIHPGCSSISEADLFGILRSSPKLRVLHFNVLIYELTDEEDTEPIHLEDLQDLNLMVGDGEPVVVHRILQLIFPGSKPLQLSVSDFYETSLADFFSRANVTRLYISSSPKPNSLFDQCPRLDILVLGVSGLNLQFLVDRVVNPAAEIFDDLGGDGVLKPASSSATRIDTLYLLWHSEFDFEEIRAVVQAHSVQRLFIYNGQLSYPTEHGRIISKNTRNIRATLSTISGCTIEYYPHDHSGGNYEGDWMDPDVWIRYSSRVLL